MLKSYLDLSFSNGNDKRLVKLGPIALFKNFILTTSNGKQFEEIIDTHIVFYMDKLITSAKFCDDLAMGFNRDRRRRQQELTNNKNVTGKYHVTFMLKDTFGSCELRKKSTCGLGYKLTLTGNKNDAVLDKAPGIPDVRIEIDNIHWYVPPFTSSIPQRGIISKQI